MIEQTGVETVGNIGEHEDPYPPLPSTELGEDLGIVVIEEEEQVAEVMGMEAEQATLDIEGG